MLLPFAIFTLDILLYRLSGVYFITVNVGFIIFCVSMILSGHFSITRAPKIKTRATVLKVHIFDDDVITYLLPNNKKLKLYSHNTKESKLLSKGDIVELEYVGWIASSVKKIARKPKETNNKKVIAK